MLDLHHSSESRDPAALAPGRDLVLIAAPEHGAELPFGVLLDDHLDGDARAALDDHAHAALAAWREIFDPLVAHGGIALPEVWHSELYMDVFLPTLRLVEGVLAAVEDLEPARLTVHDATHAVLAALRTALAPRGWQVVADGSVVPDPVSPPFARPPLSLRTLPVHVMDAFGLPTFGRADVLVLPYASTAAVMERLLADGGFKPMAYPPVIAPPQKALRALRATGVSGRPGARARFLSHRRTSRLIARTANVGFRWPVDGADLGPVLSARARDYLRRRAFETFAEAGTVDKALRRAGIRAVLLPFDWEPPGRVVASVARERGVPSMALQHGYEPRKIFAPGGVSDLTGAWSHWDVEAWGPQRVQRVRVVGDPSKAVRPEPRPRPATAPGRRPRAVVLVQHEFRPSARLDGRVSAQHLGVAVDGLRATGRDFEIVIRPHPSDPLAPFEALGAKLGASVDQSTNMLDLLAGCDICVGATSTATLETAVVGVPVVMLNPTGWDWAPPLDGSGDIPYATNAAELAAEVERVLALPEPPGREELLAALGYEVDDPAGVVARWLQDIAARVECVAP